MPLSALNSKCSFFLIYTRTKHFIFENLYLYPPQTVFVGGYTVFTLSVRPSIRPSVTFCFLNNFKSHGWNFIKPCIHIHIYRANTYNKK